MKLCNKVKKRKMDKRITYSIIGILLIAIVVGAFSISQSNNSATGNSFFNFKERFSGFKSNFNSNSTTQEGAKLPSDKEAPSNNGAPSDQEVPSNQEMPSKSPGYLGPPIGTGEGNSTGIGEINSTGYECDYTGSIVPFNQGLLDYTISSSISKNDSKNKVDMSRRFSVVDKEKAEKYLLLKDFGNYTMNQVIFSKLEYFACMIPDWLYEKLEGLYLVRYHDKNVARASVMVLKDRETAVYVAQLLLAASTDDLQFKTINGNYVAYTAQGAYWWTHDNLIIRIAAHTAPEINKKGEVIQNGSFDFGPCEQLDVLDDMDLAKCIKDQFWQEVPQDILYAYLNKLPSDGEEITWPEKGQFADLLNESDWQSHDEAGEHQWGCDPERNKEINDAFAAMEGAFSGDKEAQRAKTMSRLDDVAKVINAETDKRWYYLGERVTFNATVLSQGKDQGVVTAEVNDDIFPNPETTTITLTPSNCGKRETYREKITGEEIPKKPEEGISGKEGNGSGYEKGTISGSPKKGGSNEKNAPEGPQGVEKKENPSFWDWLKSLF